MRDVLEHFHNLLAPYPNAPMATFWDEVEAHYTETNRHYHNLTHIDHVLQELEEVRRYVQDWDALRFAAVYHDIIYKIPGRNNEKKSALLATERLGELGLELPRAARVHDHIVATKEHRMTADTDTNLLCDADLSILGHERARYAEYMQSIRREYGNIPDLIYRPGRRKVLRAFLERPVIFNTPVFRRRYEVTARENLEWELSLLA